MVNVFFTNVFGGLRGFLNTKPMELEWRLEYFNFALSFSNGETEKEISLENFPTPGELWQKYKEYKGINTEVTINIYCTIYSNQ